MILEHKAVLEELDKPEYGPSKKKHMLQNSSLLGHLEVSNLLKSKTCFIELGAGRGQLSYWLGKALGNDKESMLLLIDKASHRHKFDNRKSQMQGCEVLRIRADISDLKLSEVNGIKKYDQIVALSKHLCGAASDLALKCLVNNTRTVGTDSLNINGILMAFCCHHRCNWDSYTGRSFFTAKGFSATDFSVMTGIASWATCGSGRSRNWKPSSSIDSDTSQLQTEVDDKDRYTKLNLSQELRKTIGRQSKLLFDYGRLKYLEEEGFTSSLLYYVCEEVSPENLCLKAVKS